MPIPARLSRTLQQKLGTEAADDLVNWMVRVDEQRSELRDFNELNHSRFDSRLGEQQHWMEAQFAEFRRTADADFAEVRQEMRAGFAEVRQEMTTEFAAVRQEIARAEARLLKWSFVFWAGAVATIVGLVG